MDRVKKLYEMFVEEYGDELEDVEELLTTLVTEVPDASNEEIVAFAINVVADNDEQAPDDPEACVDEFTTTWGSKT